MANNFYLFWIWASFFPETFTEDFCEAVDEPERRFHQRVEDVRGRQVVVVEQRQEGHQDQLEPEPDPIVEAERRPARITATQILLEISDLSWHFAPGILKLSESHCYYKLSKQLVKWSFNWFDSHSTNLSFERVIIDHII